MSFRNHRTLAKLRRPLVLAGLVSVILCFLTFTDRTGEWSLPESLLEPSQFLKGGPRRMLNAAPLRPLSERVTCLGPRDKFLDKSEDDALHAVSISDAYPIPFIGSHEALGLEKTWMTSEGRYGPYGYGEDDPAYNRSRVAWDNIDWGNLQNACFDRNARRFPTEATRFSNAVRFSFLNKTRIPATPSWNDFKRTRRTAIIVRAWDGYEYKDEDMHYLRSLIVETSLRTGGEYQVVLLVNIKDQNSNIFASEDAYTTAFEKAGIPKELESIAVLWDDNLLASWYSNITEHATVYQVFQPVQLFALHYPEYDHFWQLELDMRFTGDAGKYLDALSAFARAEPRKQALERASFQLIQSETGDFANFSHAVNTANHGGSHWWGPVPNPDLAPIGPAPPTRQPTDKGAWAWGVGEDADALVTSFVMNATASKVWLYKDWFAGFSDEGLAAPRFFSPPAIQRGSRALLLAIHEAQLTRGMYVPSEATLPAFALWLGMKLSYPPHPVYRKTNEDMENTAGWWKGGPLVSPSGLGPEDAGHPGGDGLSFWWESSWPRQVVDSWTGADPTPGDPDFPWLLATADNQVLAPNMMLHPCKHH